MKAKTLTASFFGGWGTLLGGTATAFVVACFEVPLFDGLLALDLVGVLAELLPSVFTEEAVLFIDRRLI